MRLALRLVLAVVISATLIVSASTFMQARREKAALSEQLERRSALVAETIRDQVAEAIAQDDPVRLALLMQRFNRRSDLAGLAVVTESGEVLAAAPDVSRHLDVILKQAPKAAQLRRPTVQWKRFPPLHIYYYPLPAAAGKGALLAVVHDPSFIYARLRSLWTHNLLLHVFLISLVTLIAIRLSVISAVNRLADWLHSARVNESVKPPPFRLGLLRPLASEAQQLVDSLGEARAAAEEEARLRSRAESVWTAERLKEHVRMRLEGKPLLVVANREPYSHVWRGKNIDVVTPPSGLVTGIEPILRACGGTWIAHGSGDADREAVDQHDRVKVPPDDPQYTLRRVWLSQEEENGYYYGFANEGLWPLCHIAHTRPSFKEADWRQYQRVNRKFADALLGEIEGMREPYVLIQDYHYALLPRMIKERRPDARVAIFWHIPWPNAETFGICPWQKDILLGMLGADLIGFHIQFHCNNFLETVDRVLESRIDWERFAVEREGHLTMVQPYPIGIAFPSHGAKRPMPDKQELLKALGAPGPFFGVGVDRVDYTKGILERCLAVERFLEKHPDYIGKFHFVELGAPSRTFIERYQQLIGEIEREVARINGRFGGRAYTPIYFLKGNHSHEEIEGYYRAADLCMVTSLHDGMNLVAKEFVASRDDEKGVLILSRFTGAAWELQEALIVNPYDIGQMADAVFAALQLAPAEQRRRVAAMRQVLKEQNVYLWASRLIDDMSRLRMRRPGLHRRPRVTAAG